MICDVDRSPEPQTKKYRQNYVQADADSSTNFESPSIPQLKSIRFGCPGTLGRCENDPFCRVRRGLLT